MKRIMLFLTSLWLVGVVSAAANQPTLKPTLVLDHAAVVKEQEGDGDELYFDIKINRANHSSQYIRVPKKPGHWSSRAINKMEAMPLWSESLAEGESVTLIVSLMESDDSPLNPDDIVGLARVKIKNTKGHLQTEWRIPNQLDGTIKKVGKRGDLQKVDLMNGQANYELYLSVKK